MFFCEAVSFASKEELERYNGLSVRTLGTVAMTFHHGRSDEGVGTKVTKMEVIIQK